MHRRHSLSLGTVIDVGPDPLDYGYDERRSNPTKASSAWQHVVHRDIKPANIFVRRPKTDGAHPPLLLGDFGLATVKPRTTNGAGTVDWQGPEWPLVTAKTDVYGLGATIHWLCHGSGPVSPAPAGYRSKELNAYYQNPATKRPRQLPSRYSEELNRNMMECLRRDPERRVNSNDLFLNLRRDCLARKARSRMDRVSAPY